MENHILSFLLVEAGGPYLSMHSAEARGSVSVQESGGVELVLQDRRISFRVLSLKIEVGTGGLP